MRHAELGVPGRAVLEYLLAAAQVENSRLQNTGIDHEVRGGVAAVGQLDIDNLGMRPIEFDVTGIEVMWIVGDIGLGDVGVTAISFDLKVEAGRIAGPARLEGGDGRIDRELWRDGQRYLRADAVAQPERAIAADALAIGDDMRISGCQLTNPAAGLVDVRVLVPVVVARDEVDSVDAIRVEEDFTKAGAIKCAVVSVGLERDDAAGVGMPPEVLD